MDQQKTTQLRAKRRINHTKCTQRRWVLTNKRREKSFFDITCCCLCKQNLHIIILSNGLQDCTDFHIFQTYLRSSSKIKLYLVSFLLTKFTTPGQVSDLFSITYLLHWLVSTRTQKVFRFCKTYSRTSLLVNS